MRNALEAGCLCYLFKAIALFLNTRPFVAAAAARNLISLPPAMRKTCPTSRKNCGGRPVCLQPCGGYDTGICRMINNPFHRLQCNGKHLGQNRGSNPRRACLCWKASISGEGIVNSLQQQQNKGSEASTRHGFFVSGGSFGFEAREHSQTCKTGKQRKL